MYMFYLRLRHFTCVSRRNLLRLLLKEMPELRWLPRTSRRFTLNLSAFRVPDPPTLVDKFFCSPAVENPSLFIGGQQVVTGECVPVDLTELGFEGSDSQEWFELKFFQNKPQLPLHLVAYTDIELGKDGAGDWPSMAYLTGTAIEPAANPSSCFVPLQRLDGMWRVLLFRFGRVALQGPGWVKDPKELEASVRGFKLSPDLKIA